MTDTNQPVPNDSDHWLSNSAYDVIKLLAMIILPALGTLYFALAAIWHFPAADQVVGTITALDTFLGILLGISHSQYMSSDSRFVGAINVTPSATGGKTFSLDVNGHPEEAIQGKGEVTFKVNQTADVGPPATD